MNETTDCFAPARSRNPENTSNPLIFLRKMAASRCFAGPIDIKTYAKDIDDNATHREARKTAERMIKMGKFSLEDISQCVPSIPFDELKELEAEIMQLA